MQLRLVATVLTALICGLWVTLSPKNGECALALCDMLNSIQLM